MFAKRRLLFFISEKGGSEDGGCGLRYGELCGYREVALIFLSYSNEETTKFKIEGRADVEKLTSGMVTDTLLIGRVADLSVYVCRADYTHKAEYTLINELAIEKKLSKLCTVINGVDLKKRKYGYYYGYGKYGKYYGYGKRYGYSYGYGEK